LNSEWEVQVSLLRQGCGDYFVGAKHGAGRRLGVESLGTMVVRNQFEVGGREGGAGDDIAEFADNCVRRRSVEWTKAD